MIAASCSLSILLSNKTLTKYVTDIYESVPGPKFNIRRTLNSASFPLISLILTSFFIDTDNPSSANTVKLYSTFDSISCFTLSFISILFISNYLFPIIGFLTCLRPYIINCLFCATLNNETHRRSVLKFIYLGIKSIIIILITKIKFYRISN